MIKAARMSEAHSSGSSARSAALVNLGLVGKLRYGDETQECWWLVEATSRLGFTVRAAVLYSKTVLVVLLCENRRSLDYRFDRP
jgi:hypothetical protein